MTPTSNNTTQQTAAAPPSTAASGTDGSSAMLSSLIAPSFSVVTGTLVLMSMEGTTDGVFDPLVLVIDDNNVVVVDDDEPDDGFDAVDDDCVESGIANGVG
mmetsp:Transcript_20649/g.35224  ORF Transcript_20649/g.35224 Transcript_20649/m.35224 type:complete len:101 (+) Transcript_20649:306-608(+)